MVFENTRLTKAYGFFINRVIKQGFITSADIFCSITWSTSTLGSVYTCINVQTAIVPSAMSLSPSLVISTPLSW